MNTYLPMCTCTHGDQVYGPKGYGCPCGSICFRPQGPKKQQNNDIVVPLDVEKEALQTNFSYFDKITSFTDNITSVENHKNSKFTENRPEHLWPFKL